MTDYGKALISAGFIDAHVHYPQTAIIASWGKRLIDWLNTYTFPEEMRFADPAYAAADCTRYFDLTLANGTTSVCSYTTIHPAIVDAFFTEAQRRGMRGYGREKPAWTATRPMGCAIPHKSAYDDSARLLGKMAWAGSAVLCHHPALFAHIDARSAGSLGRTLGRTP